MSKAYSPEFKKKNYGQEVILEIKWWQTFNVQGILWGLDPFMNLMIDECVEMPTSGQQNNTEMVAIQGNSVITLEALEQAQGMAVVTREINCFHKALSTAQFATI